MDPSSAAPPQLARGRSLSNLFTSILLPYNVMNASQQLQTAPPPATLSPEIIGLLHHVTMLSSLDDQALHCFDDTRELCLEPHALLIHQGEVTRHFWILLDGSMDVIYPDPHNHEQIVYTHTGGNSFGEVSLLTGLPSATDHRAKTSARLLELDEEQFWRLLTLYPEVRRAILSNMAMRLAKVHTATAQQEKMASLGTMAAGLMHELNNPGVAARRASTQLRENLSRMHKLSAKWARTQLTEAQKQCMYDLQEYALSTRPHVALSSLEQADAEETLTSWMEAAGVEDAWKLAPTLVSISLDSDALECARATVPRSHFSDAVSWLEAMISSMQLVGTIEESIGRVTELVAAVKSYAYEGRGQKQALDVNRSIHATLVILGHKLREKQITVEKDLAPNLPNLTTDCGGLNQIWTNLLDNAIDAAPQGGRIQVKTWAEPSPGRPASQPTDLCILVSDNGSGIPNETQPHIFDPFYTTKPVGIGTGLGLGIVHRIIEQIGGTIRFTSMPGDTEFVVRLPTTHS